MLDDRKSPCNTGIGQSRKKKSEMPDIVPDWKEFYEPGRGY